MHRGRRMWVAVVGLVAALSVHAAAINLFQTAEPLGSGGSTLTVGTGLVSRKAGGGTEWFLTPQLRFTLGWSDTIDLGIHTGGLSRVGTAKVDWLGILVDVEIPLMRRPGAFTFAWGAGAGTGLDLFGEGWGAFGQLLFETQATPLPIFVVYRPVFPFDAGTFALAHYVAGGVWLRLAPIARGFLMIDLTREQWSVGFGVEFLF